MDYVILVFDGVCNFCNGFVNFIIDSDPKKKVKFIASQTPKAKEVFKKHKIPEKTIKDSIILIEGERYTTRSTAFLHLMKYLKFPYFLLFSFISIPKWIRDPIYEYISKNRYKWFGKRKTCRMPTKELKERFLY